MNILAINKHDIYGGAAHIAFDLFQGLRKRGHNSYLAVAIRYSSDPSIFIIPDLPPKPRNWSRLMWQLREPWKKRIGKRGTGVVMRLLRTFADPEGENERQQGYEVFHFPGSRNILELPPQKPQILHMHNLHNDFFDLRQLPLLSKEIPIFFTLHDEWLFTGHCACTLGCDRWKLGCGECPDLTIYPSIPRDGTHHNWIHKESIFAKSNLYIATPSHWLMDRVKQSILAKGLIEGRVIPNGVDQVVFTPSDRTSVRLRLGIKKDDAVVLFHCARDPSTNRFKDFVTIQRSIEIIITKYPDANLVIIGIGSDDAKEYFKSTKVRICGYIKNPEKVSSYYQAADVLLHASHADTFPTTILESLSCGTPVVATEVGGISEQVKHEVNGFLVGHQNAQDMADYAIKILSDKSLQKKMRTAAIANSRPFYSIECMVSSYESWYTEVLSRLITYIQ